MIKYPQDGYTKYILDDLPDNIELSSIPVEYWILHLYVIVLRQNSSTQYPLLDTGDFLLLEHPSYAYHNSSIWSTPYLAYRVDTETKRYNKVLDIVKLYEEKCKSQANILKELTNYRFYHMGISSYDFKDERTYIEYKQSPRQPNVWKCYYIKERFVNNIDSLGLQNLIDPEGLHAYGYLPITPSVVSDALYGKPLSTNVAYLFDNEFIHRKAKAQIIDTRVFRTRHKGYLIKFDIVSFTKIMHYIEADYRSFEFSGSQYSEAFVIYLQQIFEQELLKANISQYRLEGDGFIASIESDLQNNDIEGVIIEMFKNIAKKITKLIKNTKLLYRASMLFGEYDYGKELGLFSKSLILSGKELIRITRMDSAVRDYIYQENQEEIPTLFFLLDSNIGNETKPYLDSLCYIRKIDNFRDIEINSNLYSLKMEDVL